MARQIKAPLTGTVWKIEVSVGDSVSEDDTLIILESMKMEIPVDAPEDGTVSALHVKEGDPVKEGQVLAELEEA